MFDFSILKAKFNNVEQINPSKICVNNELIEVLEYLKNTPVFDFDMLTSIVAIDLKDNIELIYQLISTKTSETLYISYICKNYTAPSVIKVYSSAYFDECEIFDLFGVEFAGNNELKRLLMPENWIGHPLLKSYVQNDERLVWNG